MTDRPEPLSNHLNPSQLFPSLLFLSVALRLHFCLATDFPPSPVDRPQPSSYSNLGNTRHL